MKILLFFVFWFICFVVGLVVIVIFVFVQEIFVFIIVSEFLCFVLVVEVGIVGIGLLFIYIVNFKFIVMVGYIWFDYNYDVELDDNEYDGKLKFFNFKVIVNWYFWGGIFYFFGGVFVSDNKVDVIF